ncbi:MAG: PASTA domain-containing protein [Ilumatobacteraceae bacterium]|jgi:hypothetical protein|nr:PASTA domain-containing protein [Ilumatobacteraceae bacterium]
MKVRKKANQLVAALAVATLLMPATLTRATVMPAKAYGTCVELRSKFVNGIAKTSALAKKNKARFSLSLYKANIALDTNKNGIACDKKDVDNPLGGNAQEDFKMPNVLCMTLQEAQDEIQDHGVFYSRSQDASGRGRGQWNDSNWIVIKQSPAPGRTISEGSPMLSAVKIGESTRGVCK